MSHWQYSLKGLIALTTIVSICLAIGVHFAGFMVVFVAIGVVQVAALLSADWLIRPQNRRALAFVTASCWIVVGSGLFLGALHTIATAALAEQDIWGKIFAVLLIVAALACFYLALQRWRKLAGQTPSSDTKESAELIRSDG